MSSKGLEKFTADNPWIFELISHFDGKATPIPWGQVGIHSSYVGYMMSNYNAAKSAVNSLALNKVPTSREATQATKDLFDQTKSTWSKASSMGVMVWESLTGGTMAVPYEILATFSASAFLEMEVGFHLHASGVAKGFLKDTEARVGRDLQRGKISEAKAVEIVRNTEKALQDHASSINDGLGAIAYLDRKGYFSTQKALGAPFIALVLGLAAIAAAALAIVSVYQISTVNNLIKEECSKFTDEKLRLACVKELSKKLPSIDFGAITGQLAKWAMIGALVIGSVWFAPIIVRSAMKSRRELKAT
jgi:hypothetical protein